MNTYFKLNEAQVHWIFYLCGIARGNGVRYLCVRDEIGGVGDAGGVGGGDEE
jgi:hypothetical protein